MAVIHVRKIGDALGAEICGVELAQPLAAEVFAQIRQAWLDHLVIRFREQRLSDPEFLAFSRFSANSMRRGPIRTARRSCPHTRR